MKENYESKKASYDEMKSNNYLLQQEIKKKNAIIKHLNEEIKELKKEVSRLRVYQLKLGE